MNKKSFMKFKKLSAFLVMFSMMLSFFPVLPASANAINGSTSFEGTSYAVGDTTSYTVYNLTDMGDYDSIQVFGNSGNTGGLDFSSVTGVTYFDTVLGDTYSANILAKNATQISFKTDNPNACEYVINGVENPTDISQQCLPNVIFKSGNSIVASLANSLTLVPGAPTSIKIAAEKAKVSADTPDDTLYVAVYDTYGNIASNAQKVDIIDNKGNIFTTIDSLSGVVDSSKKFSSTTAGEYTVTAITYVGETKLTSEPAAIAVTPGKTKTYTPEFKGSTIPDAKKVTGYTSYLDESDTATVSLTAYDQFDNKQTAASVVYFTYEGTNVKSVKFYDATGTLIGEKGTPFTTSGTFSIKALKGTGQEAPVFKIKISDNQGTPVEIIDNIYVTRVFSQKVTANLPDTMTINQRNPITITLYDLKGENTYKALSDVPVGLASTGRGSFYASAAKNDQQALKNEAIIPEGADHVTFWYQPTDIDKYDFTFSADGAEPVTSTVSCVYGAGSSFIYGEVYDNYQEVSEAGEATVHPEKLTFTIYDQYGNPQLNQEPITLDLNTYDPVKLYANETCAPGTEITSVTVPTGSVSANVYALSKYADYYYDSNYYVRASYNNLPSESDSLNFVPGDIAKAKVVGYNQDENGQIFTYRGDTVTLAVQAFDRFGNYIDYAEYSKWCSSYEKTLLTASLRLDGNGILRGDYDNLGGPITQVKVGEHFWYTSDDTGTATISAVLGGNQDIQIPVDSANIIVGDDYFNLYVGGSDGNDYENDGYFANPEWRVPLVPEFYGLPTNTTVNYVAYTIQNGVEVGIPNAFYAEPTSGENITQTGYNYGDIWFEVPAMADGTVIYIKGTPEDASFQARTVKITVKRHANWGRSLERGWNILSTPFALTPAGKYINNVIADPAYIKAAYRYNQTTGQFEQIVGSSLASLEVKPLEAYYVKLSGDSSASFVGNEAPTAPPVRTLAKGWNLISPALDINIADNDTADRAFASLMPTNFNIINGVNLNSSLLVSPVFNPEKFAAATQEDYDAYNVYAGYGYWIYMNNQTDLTGFSTTPVEQLDYYGGY